MEKQPMTEKQATINHGEGDPEAAERFNVAETAFVESARGRKKIQQGAQVRPEETAELDGAEAAGRRHAKDDPADTLRPGSADPGRRVITPCGGCRSSRI